MNGVGMPALTAHEHVLTQHAHARLEGIDGLRFYGTAPCKAGVVSFLVDGVHPYDLGTLLDQLGIAVRTGHHCTEPLMDKLGIPGTVRASFGAYNTVEEIDRLADAVERAVSIALTQTGDAGHHDAHTRRLPLHHGISDRRTSSRDCREFAMFGDWMEKYEHIISLGKELAPLDPEDKVDENLIKGCQSRVWLTAKRGDDMWCVHRGQRRHHHQGAGRTHGPRAQRRPRGGHRLGEAVLSRRDRLAQPPEPHPKQRPAIHGQADEAVRLGVDGQERDCQ